MASEDVPTRENSEKLQIKQQGINKIKQLRHVEKPTLLNDKIPSKSNYENISPKT